MWHPSTKNRGDGLFHIQVERIDILAANIPQQQRRVVRVQSKPKALCPREMPILQIGNLLRLRSMQADAEDTLSGLLIQEKVKKLAIL